MYQIEVWNLIIGSFEIAVPISGNVDEIILLIFQIKQFELNLSGRIERFVVT